MKNSRLREVRGRTYGIAKCDTFKTVIGWLYTLIENFRKVKING